MYSSFFIEKIKIKVREITQNNRTAQNEASITSTTTSLLNSVKYLEQDLDVMRRLYENEMRILYFQIDDINNERNKYTLELYNKEVKLKEITNK